MADNENTILTEEESTRIINLSEAAEMDAGMYFVTDSSNGTRKVPITKLIDANLEDEYAAAPAKEVGDLKEDLENEVTAREEADTAINTDLARKANVDGAYDSMTVGNAEQLVSNQYIEDKVPYLFRTSGGSADIGNREEDVIVGGTVAWNQLVQNGNFSDGTNGWRIYNSNNGSLSVSNGIATLSYTTEGAGGYAYGLQATPTPLTSETGHKYFVMSQVKANFVGSVAYEVGSSIANNVPIIQNQWINVATVCSKTSSGTTLMVKPVNSTIVSGSTMQVKNFILIDLTQLFGSTIADYIYSLEQATAGSGVAKLKSWGFFTEDYYPYCEPTNRSVEGLQSHDMVGFNQWDEEWENGYYNSNGVLVESNQYICSKNFIRLVRGNEYYLNFPVAMSISFYDSNKEYIGKAIGTWKDEVFRPVHYGEARYFKFNSAASGALTTYNNDICINLHWSGTRDGEYEPYVKHSYPLDSSVILRGVPKQDDNGELYYDGDRYLPDGTVERRVKVFTLGAPSTVVKEGNLYRISYNDADNPLIGAKPYAIGLLENYSYTFKTSYANVNNEDKSIGINMLSNRQFILRDDSLADAEAITSMLTNNPIVMVYELATPTTEQADPYQTPQIVDDWGTEEYVTESIVPVGHVTKYPANLRDKVQHLPNLADDDGFYLIQQAGTQMNLVAFHIPRATGLADGTYTLKATVSGGTPTYTWESEE